MTPKPAAAPTCKNCSVTSREVQDKDGVQLVVTLPMASPWGPAFLLGVRQPGKPHLPDLEGLTVRGVWQEAPTPGCGFVAHHGGMQCTDYPKLDLNQSSGFLTIPSGETPEASVSPVVKSEY